jgi:DNA-binding CsgD family transcriptional regulator
MRHWLVNLYPVKDELGQVQLVAAAFSEVTKSRDVELKLGRIKDKFRAGDQVERAHLGEEFSELSAQTFEVVGRSVALLKTSMSLRSYVSEIQLEAGLERLDLSLSVVRPQEKPQESEPTPRGSEEELTSPAEAPAVDEVSAGGPSFRERQVLRHLADGKSNKEIGAVLHISTRTVESYRARIMCRLDLHSTAALVRYAIREKIIEA